PRSGTSSRGRSTRIPAASWLACPISSSTRRSFSRCPEVPPTSWTRPRAAPSRPAAPRPWTSAGSRLRLSRATAGRGPRAGCTKGTREMPTLIKAEHLVKDFPVKGAFLGKKRKFVHAVDDVDISIEEGEVLGLAGESGSGKSTTGRLLIRLVEPSSGRIEYRGRDITEYPKRELEALRAKVQMIFQDPVSSLSPRMSVGEAIGHPLAIHGMRDKAMRKAAVIGMMEKVGLSP